VVEVAVRNLYYAAEKDIEKAEHGFEQRLRAGVDARLDENTNITVLGSLGSTAGVDTETDAAQSKGLNHARLDTADVTRHMKEWDLSLGRLTEPMGVTGYYFGKDDPSELGWERPETIFDEPVAKADVVTEDIPKGRILMQYVVKNPAVWFLCIANVAAYCVRIGIDNWNVLYTHDVLGFSDYTAVNTTIALEMGGLAGSLCWGFFSDKLGGRRAVTAAIGIGLVIIPIMIYAHATSEIVVYGALFCIGFLIFGPVPLIGICGILRHHA